jgi:hypothetical protein
MRPDAHKEVHYTSGGEQFGPVPLDRLKELCSAGEIDRGADFVWWEGLSDWVPAGQVEGLFPGPPPARRPTGGGGAADIPRRPKRASFGLVLTLWIVSFGVYILGFVVLIAAAVEDEEAVLVIGVLVVLAAVVGFIVGAVIALIYLYRAWLIVQGSTARTTPGKAVGFLFIPLFNLYWVFQAYHGWAQDYNAFRDRRGLTGAPQMPEGLFLAVSILTVLSAIPYVNMLIGLPLTICWFIMLHRLCKAVNHFAVA